MRIVSAASAFPKHYYSQEMLLAALQEYWGNQVENPHVLRRLHRHVGVDGRFLALPKEEYVKMRTWCEGCHRCSRGRRPARTKSRSVLFCFSDRHQQPLHRRAVNQSNGIVPEYSPGADFRPGVCG